MNLRCMPLPSMLWPREEGFYITLNLYSLLLHCSLPSPLASTFTHLTVSSSISMDLSFGYNPPAIPIEIFRAVYSEERCIYSRLVFDLAMDPGLSMDVVAFWLWLQENGQPNTIQSLKLLKNEGLRTIADVAQTFVLALRQQPPPAPEVARLLPSPELSEVLFHRAALRGVTYYLKKVCIKALSDIRAKAEEQLATAANMQMLVQNMARASLVDQTAARPAMFSRPYVPHGEGTSRGPAAAAPAKSGNPFFVLLGAGQGIDQLPLHDTVIDIEAPPRAVGNKLVKSKETYFTPPGYRCTCFPTEPYIPIEERMLFVTFSNGHPFAPKELHSFFMREYGDVEMVEVHNGTGRGGVALFAHVAFYTLAMVLHILNGSEKVKFISNGKHLWARRFIPRSRYFLEAK